MLHKTIESVLQRGEKIDDLVQKSDGLSAQSKMFYRKSVSGFDFRTIANAGTPQNKRRSKTHAGMFLKCSSKLPVTAVASFL